MDKIDLWEAQCFFRHLNENNPYNESVLNLNPEEKEFYKKISFYYGMVPKDIQDITKNIMEQIQKLIIRLIPLYQIGIRYDVYLAGGAIRDLVYGNHNNIKDLDIIFSINEKSIVNVLRNTPIITLEAILGKEISENINWRNDSTTKKIHSFFINCLKKDYAISRGFTIEDIISKGEPHEYDSILNQSLEGILTIHDSADKYPMDLLLTTSTISQFIDTFNFEICKVYIPFFSQNNSTIMTNPVYFLEQIHVTSGFISDGRNKTITFNMSNQKSIESIEKSINNHFPRVSQKYEKHKLILNPGNNQEYALWKSKYEDYINLHKILPKKIEPETSGENKKILKI